MGLFSGNKDELLHKLGQLEARCELLQLQNNELKQEKAALSMQIQGLQDAVVAVKSPQAYRMIQDDRMIKDWDDNNPKAPVPGEDEFTKACKYTSQAMEGPLLRTADDLFALLGRSQGAPAQGPMTEYTKES